MKFKSKLAAVSYPALCWIACAQTQAVPASEGIDIPPSLALTPAVIMVRCKPGQSTTQTLTVVNHTGSEIGFSLVTEDVVVREGRRSFSPAGQIANGIASSSVVSPPSVMVKAGEEASVQVTLTLPPETGQRAVVTVFRGSAAVPPGPGSVALEASLGTLITFNVSSDYQLQAGPVQTSLQTPAANMILSHELRNRGSEPVIPKGVIVILNPSGRRVAKALFSPQRLLPGERLMFSATNPAQLAPGHYRTLSSFEFERKILTSAGEFTIPE